MPVLATLQEELASEHLAVVTVCTEAPADQARDVLHEQGIDLLVLMDEDGQAGKVYRVRGTPTTYLIGRDGVIRMFDIGYGPGTQDQLRAEIRRLVGD